MAPELGGANWKDWDLRDLFEVEEKVREQSEKQFEKKQTIWWNSELQDPDHATFTKQSLLLLREGQKPSSIGELSRARRIGGASSSYVFVLRFTCGVCRIIHQVGDPALSIERGNCVPELEFDSRGVLWVKKWCCYGFCCCCNYPLTTPGN